MPDNPIILDIQGDNSLLLLDLEPFSKGDPGKSAYQVAVDNGFSGTEEEWLASLVGPQGPQGIQGPQGSTGPQGQTGPQGVAGNDGFSPTATVTKSGSVATITITDKNGTTTANVYDGSGGGGNVNSVNGQTGDVVLDAEDVGALSDSTVIPSKTSDLTNDSGFITGYTETDPTVPSWAKQATKPTYTASEVGALPDSTEIDDVYWCTYGTTTSAEIETALTAGKIPMVQYQSYVYTLRYRNSATNHRFVCNYGGKEKSVACQSGTWMPNGDLTFLTTSYIAPVTSVNGQTGAVTVSVPTKVSDLSNDAGYITSYTETDPVFSDSAAAGITSANISGWNAKATKTVLTATIAAADWTGSDPYTNTVIVSGLLATDTPTMDLVASSTYATAQNEIADYAYIYKAACSANTLTVYATQTPSVNLNIQLVCVR